MSLINLLKKKSKITTFTTPSHSQNFFIFSKLRQFYKHDISETEAHNPEEALLAAEKKAAKIYKTKSTYFLTNGSTSGIIAAVLACVEKDEKVLIRKDSHPSHQNAITLSGGIPIFYESEKDEKWDIYKKTNPETIENILKTEEYGKIKAVIITSPTYEGIVSDIKELSKICKKYGSHLIVDEAHGALYPFSGKLPESAIYQGADFVIQSLHKTAGGLNPTALLHCNVSFSSPLEGEGRISKRGTSFRNLGEGSLLQSKIDVESALKLISTTSPSYPLLASIEKNINFLNSTLGRKKISELVENIETIKKSLNEGTKCHFSGDDITKILVKIEGLTGSELSKKLYENGIEDEITNEKSSMLLTGIGTDLKKLKKLKHVLRKLSL